MNITSCGFGRIELSSSSAHGRLSDHNPGRVSYTSDLYHNAPRDECINVCSHCRNPLQANRPCKCKCVATLQHTIQHLFDAEGRRDTSLHAAHATVSESNTLTCTRAVSTLAGPASSRFKQRHIREGKRHKGREIPIFHRNPHGQCTDNIRSLTRMCKVRKTALGLRAGSIQRIHLGGGTAALFAMSSDRSRNERQSSASENEDPQLATWIPESGSECGISVMTGDGRMDDLEINQ